MVVASRDGGSSEAEGLAVVNPPEYVQSGITLQGVNASATAGTPFSGSLATFTDPDLDDVASNFSATIYWASNPQGWYQDSETGTITGSDGEFTISGSINFDTGGDETVWIAVSGGSEGFYTYPTAISSILVTDPPIQLQAETPNVNQNGPGTLSGYVAEITNALSNCTYTVTIALGDGYSYTETVGSGSGGGTVQIPVSYLYFQNGSYDITVTVSQGTNAYATTQTSADIDTVNNPDLPYGYGWLIQGSDVLGSGTTISVQEGGSFNGQVGSFMSMRDGASAGDFTAVIYWGDGSVSDGTVQSGSGNGFAVDGEHTYANRGTYSITIEVTDNVVEKLYEEYYEDWYWDYYWDYYYWDWGYYYDPYWYGWDYYYYAGLYDVTSFDFTSAATVTASSITLTPGDDLTSQAGEELSGAILATGETDDSNSSDDFTALVAWGDGTSSVEAVRAEDNSFEVEGDHTYETPGTFTASVTIYDGTNAYVTTTAITVDPASSEDETPITAEAEDIEGEAGEEMTKVLVATLTDDNPAHIGGVHIITINWGDGTTSTGMAESTDEEDEYEILGTHTYANPGDYVFHVTVEDQGETTTASAIASIDGDGIDLTGIDVHGMIVQYEPNASIVVASFTDDNPDDTSSAFQASVNLGVGSPTVAGQVVGGDGQFFVTIPSSAIAESDFSKFDNSYWENYWTYWYGPAWWALVAYQVAGDSTISVTVSQGHSVVGSVDSTLAADQAVAGYPYVPTLLLPTETKGAFAYQITDWGDGSNLLDYGNNYYYDYYYDYDYYYYYDWYWYNDSYGYWYYDYSPIAHIYDQPGNYTISFTASPIPSDSSDSGSGDSYTNTITVAPSPLIPAYTNSSGIASPLAGVANEPLDDVPLFTFYDADSEDEDEYSVWIDWGDGQASAGTVEQNPQGNFDVYGDHTYNVSGTFAISVVVQDEAGASVVGGRDAIVSLNAETEEFGAYENVSTGNVVLATIPDAEEDTEDGMTATIDWGDGTYPVAATISYDEEENEVLIVGSHVYNDPGTFDVNLEINQYGQTTYVGTQATIESDWSISGGQLTNQENEAEVVDLGQAAVAPNTGGLLVSEALDFDQSPGTSVGGDPVLTYNSDTASPQPIIQAELQSNPDGPVPDEIQVQLTWNGVVQDWITYATTGHEAGDIYMLTAQVDQPVTASGIYDWSLDVVLDFGSEEPQYNVGLSGSARVVVNNSPEPDPDDPFESIDFFGTGWGIQGIDRLIVDEEDNVLWVNGDGDSEVFTRNADGSYANPPTDFGKLVQNEDLSYTYTAVNKTKYEFDQFGLLTAVISPNEQETTYEYTVQGQLEQVTAPDDGITTFDYNPETLLLESITEPGGRTFEFEHDGNGDISVITDPDDIERSFDYDDEGHMIEQTIGPLNLDDEGEINEEYTYIAGPGILSEVNDGMGVTYQIIAQASIALNTTVAPSQNPAMAKIVDATSDTTRYGLDIEGRILEEIDADDNTQKWVRDAHGQVTSYTDGDGYETTYEYDYSTSGAGTLIEVTEPDGNDVDYQYDPTFHEAIAMETGGADGSEADTEYAYDPDTGELLSTTDPDGNTTSETWVGGLLMTSTNALGKVTEYEYDDDNRLEEETDPLGNITRFVYNALGDLSQETDPDGDETEYEYDDDGDLIGETDADGTPVQQTTTTVYNALGDIVSQTDGDGDTITDEYDNDGRLSSQTDAMENSTEYVYNDDGELVGETDPLGNTTTTFYDADGNVTETIDPLGNITTSLYDADGNVTATTDPLGKQSTYEYDEEDRLISETDPQGITTTTEYDLAGNVTATTDGNGKELTYAYNDDDKLISETDPDGNTTTDEYDADGNMTASIDAMGKQTTYAYNADDEEIGVTDALGNTKTTLYDADGNVTETIDAEGQETKYAFNADGEETSVTDPLGNATTTEFDADGNVTATIDALGKRTTYTYNADGEQTSETDAPGTLRRPCTMPMAMSPLPSTHSASRPPTPTTRMGRRRARPIRSVM